jgi:hypothetical protein
MPYEGDPGELASARLDLPTSFRSRASRTAAGRRRNDATALEASIRRDRSGALVVVANAVPGGAGPIPLLACLQFIARFEDSAAEALTKVTSGKP